MYGQILSISVELARMVEASPTQLLYIVKYVENLSRFFMLTQVTDAVVEIMKQAKSLMSAQSFARIFCL